MKKIKIGFLVTIIVCIGLVTLSSCSKENNGVEKPTPTLKVTGADGTELPQSYDISSDGGEISFKIEAVGDEWGLTLDNTAFWVSQKDRSDDGITFSISKETQGIDRSTTISFWLRANITIKQSIVINQSAGVPNLELPTANVLDVVFNADGSATDISPMNNIIQKLTYSNPFSIEHNDDYDLNVVSFNPVAIGGTYAANTGSYYRIDYEGNSALKDKLAQSNTYEALVKFSNDYTSGSNPVTSEVKFFSSQQSGGGTLLQMVSAAHNPKSAIAFCTYTNPTEVKAGGGTQYFVETGLQPNATDWYHIVGVRDVEAGMSYVYVNGVKMGEKATPGYYSFPVSGSQWIGIGGDAGTGDKLEASFGGKVAIARIYDKALSGEEINNLYNSLK